MVEKLLMTSWGWTGVKTPKISLYRRFPMLKLALKRQEDRCYKKSHSIVNLWWIWKWKTYFDSGKIRDYENVIIFIGWFIVASQLRVYHPRKSDHCSDACKCTARHNTRLIYKLLIDIDWFTLHIIIYIMCEWTTLTKINKNQTISSTRRRMAIHERSSAGKQGFHAR